MLNINTLSMPLNSPVLTRSGPGLTGACFFFLRPVFGSMRHRSDSGTADISCCDVMTDPVRTEDEMRDSRLDRGMRGRIADRSTEVVEGLAAVEDFLLLPPPLFCGGWTM